MPNTYYYTSRQTTYTNQTSQTTSRSTTSSYTTSWTTSYTTSWTTSWTTAWTTSRSTSRSTSYSTSRNTNRSTSYTTSWSTSKNTTVSNSTSYNTSRSTTTSWTTSYSANTSRTTTLYTNTNRSTTKTTNTSWQYYVSTTYPQTTINTTTATTRNTNFYATNAEKHFAPKLYTGNSTARSITGLGFAPDFVWIFTRTGANEHPVIYDSVRGPGKGLLTTLTNTEYDHSYTVTSFDSDGFSLGTDATQWVNHSGRNYVAFCLRAGGTPTSGNPYMVDGNGYSTLSASPFNDDGDLDLYEASINKKIGFGIYRFHPNTQSETNSFDHGLDAAPELVISKSSSHVYNWWTFSNKVDGSWDYFKLNGTNAKIDDIYTSGNFADGTKMRWSNAFMGSSSNHVAYAFHSVTGVSKVGSYEGTGTSGNSITTGFKPRFVMIKNADDTGQWMIYDSIRDTDGTLNKYVVPNSATIEASASTASVTPTATGFTLGNSNSLHLNRSGDTFIYLAYA